MKKVSTRATNRVSRKRHHKVTDAVRSWGGHPKKREARRRMRRDAENEILEQLDLPCGRRRHGESSYGGGQYLSPKTASMLAVTAAEIRRLPGDAAAALHEVLCLEGSRCPEPEATRMTPWEEVVRVVEASRRKAEAEAARQKAARRAAFAREQERRRICVSDARKKALRQQEDWEYQLPAILAGERREEIQSHNQALKDLERPVKDGCIRVVHWARVSKKEFDPFKGVFYRAARNTGGVCLDWTLSGVWCVPDGSLRLWWADRFGYTDRQVLVVADVPEERLRAFRQAREVRLPRTRFLLEDLCRDPDNGLLVDRIQPEEVVAVYFGEPEVVHQDWTPEVRLVPIDQSWFSEEDC